MAVLQILRPVAAVRKGPLAFPVVAAAYIRPAVEGMAADIVGASVAGQAVDTVRMDLVEVVAERKGSAADSPGNIPVVAQEDNRLVVASLVADPAVDTVGTDLAEVPAELEALAELEVLVDFGRQKYHSDLQVVAELVDYQHLAGLADPVRLVMGRILLLPDFVDLDCLTSTVFYGTNAVMASLLPFN